MMLFATRHECFWQFLVMVKDSQCTSGKSEIWKFFNDATLSEGLQRNDLRWNKQIAMIVTKGSKRLPILRFLRREDPPHDLITIYDAFITSILE